MKSNHMLDKERMFFYKHLAEWLMYYPGKFVLIKDDLFCGIFERMEDALAEGVRLFGVNSFLVRKIAKIEEPIFIPCFDTGGAGRISHYQ
ncbi:MAG: hypothetical protein ACHQQQ_13165 [Bacteroidota bacterium]